MITILVCLNIITFLLYGWDKLCAIRHSWRVPEKILLFFAFAFGSVGAYLAMQIFRHKTKHKKFYILVPIFMIIHIAILYMIKNSY